MKQQDTICLVVENGLQSRRAPIIGVFVRRVNDVEFLKILKNGWRWINVKKRELRCNFEGYINVYRENKERPKHYTKFYSGAVESRDDSRIASLFLDTMESEFWQSPTVLIGFALSTFENTLLSLCSYWPSHKDRFF